MQRDNNKYLQFNKEVGRTIQDLRISEKDLSINKLALEYGLDRGNLSRIENGKTDPQFSTVWRISEALGLKFSEFAKKIEENLGENFTFIDE